VQEAMFLLNSRCLDLPSSFEHFWCYWDGRIIIFTYSTIVFKNVFVFSNNFLCFCGKTDYS